MGLPQLPPEITDHIIDYLHDSPQDLRDCARVCRAWLDSSRSHLFYRITLSPNIRPLPAYPRLYMAIRRSPHIALYVRELFFSDFSSWGVLIKDIPQLLQSFTRLRKLDLVTMEWTLLVPEIRNSIHDILALPSLIHFEIHSGFTRLEDFSNLLYPHLKHLHLSTDKYTIEEAFSELPTHDSEEFDSLVQAYHEAQKRIEREVTLERQPCRLEFLEWEQRYQRPAVMDFLLGAPSVVDFSNLRTLVASVEDMESLMRLLKTLGSSLEHLTIDTHTETVWDSFPDEIRLGHKPNIKTLSFGTIFCSKAARRLTQILPDLITPGLYQISFRFSFPLFEIDLDTVWNDWIGVCRVFANRPPGSLGVKMALDLPTRWSLDHKLFYKKFAKHCGELRVVM